MLTVVCLRRDESQAERDDGRGYENYQCNVLQRLPDQLQKCFRRLGRNHIRTEHIPTMNQIALRSTQTCSEYTTEYCLENLDKNTHTQSFSVRVHGLIFQKQRQHISK